MLQWRAYRFWIDLWRKVARAVNENVRDVALLVHDARERALVVIPWSQRLLRETLDAPKGRVLDRHYEEAFRVETRSICI